MVDTNTFLKSARGIVIHNSERYRIFLDNYIRDSEAAGYPLDVQPYLSATMNGIYFASLNEAMWNDWDSIDQSTMVENITTLHESISQMARQSNVDLHTPSYACMIIFTSLSRTDPSEHDIREIRSLDKSILAFFDHARNQIVDNMYHSKK